MTRTADDHGADDTLVRSGPFRRLYGAAWWHLLALLGCFALSAYAVSRLLDDLPVLLRIAVWFVGAALAWDLVLGPALAGADRVLRRVLPGAALNYVRVPALVSLLLLTVWLPVILQRSEGVFRTKAGLTQDPFLGRWLVLTAVLFTGSALVYAVARWRRRDAGAARSEAVVASSPPAP